MIQDNELNEILNAYNHKLEEARLLNLQSWVLNLQNYTSLQKQKANAKLKGLTLQKTVLAVAGILYGAALLFLVVNSLQWSKIFFVVCCTAIAVITIIAAIVYFVQVSWIRKFNHTDSIVESQERLTKLQNSTIQVTRILFLQLPFYCLWFVTPAMIKGSVPAFLFITLPIALLFAFASFWLYKNIDLKNADKKWFKILFGSKEWISLVKSKKFLDDIEEFKKEIVIK